MLYDMSIIVILLHFFSGTLVTEKAQIIIFFWKIGLLFTTYKLDFRMQLKPKIDNLIICCNVVILLILPY